MKSRILELTKNKFVKNVLIVASGTAGAQIIGVLFAPFITRFYGPDAYGVLGMFMAIVVVIKPISALTYPVSIVLPKNDEDAIGIAKLSAISAVIMASVLIFVLAIFSELIINSLNIQEISYFVYLLPIVILILACLQINEQWLIRKKQFSIKAKIEAFQSFIVNGTKASIGLIKPLASVLVSVYILGILFHSIVLTKSTSVYKQFKNSKHTLKNIWHLAVKYQEFAKYQSTQQFIMYFSKSLPTVVLGAFFSPAAAGFYIICHKVLGKPISLIGKSVGDVFYQKIVEASHDNKNVRSLMINATIKMGLIGLLPYLAVIIFGPSLFGIVFGQEWTVSGEYARWLSLFFYIQLTSKPIVRGGIFVLKLQKEYLIFEMITSIAVLIGFGIVIHMSYSELIAVAVYSLVSFISLLTFMLFVLSRKYNK